nr:hypothetical protein [Tanacetum cinerariifolium]
TRVEGSVWGRVVEVMGSSGDSGEGVGTWESVVAEMVGK